MKKLKAAERFAAILVFTAVTTLCALFALTCSKHLNNKRIILSAPADVSIDDDILTWTPIKNAVEYAVYVDGKEYITTEAAFDLFKITSNYGTYKISVKAHGDLIDVLDSDKSREIEYTVKDNGTLFLAHTEPDGSVSLKANSLTKSAGTVIIPSKINEKTITCLDKNAFENFSEVTKIYIPDSITFLRNAAFKNCTSLKNVRIPETMTVLNMKAFDNCVNYKTISISENVNTIYGNFNSFNEIEIDTNNEVYKSDGNCVLRKDNDTTLFYGSCGSVIPEYVTEIFDYAFSNVNIIDLTVPDSVKAIGAGAFANCTALKKITLPKYLSVIEFNTFRNCHLLSEVNFPMQLSVIESDAFASCYSLSEINYPEYLSVIEKNAFKSCHSLSKITIPASVNKIDQAFIDCPILTEIKVDPLNKTYKSDENCLIETDINTVIFGNKTSVIPDYVTAIGKSAFSHSDVSIVIIPDGVKTIESFAFSACKNLTSVYLPESIEYIERNAFTECNKLQGVTLHPGIKKIDNESFGIDYGVHDFSSNGTAAYIPFNFKDKNDLPYGGCASLGGNVPVFTDCSIGYDGVYAYVKSFVYEYKRLSNSSSYIVKDCSIDCLVAERSPVEPSYYTKFEYAANLRAPVRMGYTFAGWATEPSGAVVYASYLNAKGILCTLSYDERQTIPSGTALYAVWTKDTE